MSVADELHLTLKSMGFLQLLVAIVFLGAYSVACSTLFGSRGRTRAAGLALLTAVAFTALTQPWVHGALLVASAVAGLGMFSAASWLLSAAFHHPQTAAVLAEEVAVEEVPPLEPVAAPTAPARVPQHTTRIPV